MFKNKYRFAPAIGVAAAKPGKSSKRPIVIASIRDRIVQRAILDVLQGHAPLEPYFKTETSFGGIKGRGVPNAIEFLQSTIESGKTYYIRSDIESFFTKVPKSIIHSRLEEVIENQDFLRLVVAAMHTELANVGSLSEEDRKLFPLYDAGVAQGSSLSPLAGNILLQKFDSDLNGRGIVCIRYIDDFILLGASERSVRAAFKAAQRLLNKYDMRAYDPASSPDKAEVGSTLTGCSFLGCDIRPGMIQPNKKSRRNLLRNVQEALARSERMMGNPEQMKKQRLSVVDALSTVNNIAKGWGNQYSFCNCPQIMTEIDDQLDELLAIYLRRYREARDAIESSEIKRQRRRLLGVHLLTDSKVSPIVGAQSADS